MSLDWGQGVSRTLDPKHRSFTGIVWQKGRPPLDSELALVSQIGGEEQRRALQAEMPSGFFLDPTRALEEKGERKERRRGKTSGPTWTPQQPRTTH